MTIRQLCIIIIISLVQSMAGIASELSDTSSVVININFNRQENISYYYYDNSEFFRNDLKLKQFVNSENDSGQVFKLNIPHSVSLNFVTGSLRSMLYVLPGDTLDIEVFGDKSPLILLNGEFKPEQNFINILNSKGLDILNQDLLLVKMDSKVKIDALMDELENLHHQRSIILDKFSDSLKFSQKYREYLRSDFKLLMLSSALRFFFELPKDNKPSEKYFLKIDSLANWLLTDSSAVPCNWYFESLSSYFYYNRGRNLGIEGRRSESTYFDTKKYLPIKQAELVQNYLLRQDCNCFTKDGYDKLVSDFTENSTQKNLIYGFQKYLQRKRQNESDLVSNTEFRKQTLKTSTGEKLTWKTILDKNRGKIIYVDVWASWCAPCRMEIPHSIKLRNEMSTDLFSFIYISIDQDETRWLRAIREEGLDTNEQDQYLISPKSALAKFLTVDAIPRYILIDREGKVLSFEAPRPSESRLKSQMNEL